MGGPWDRPIAADYAWDAARRAQQETKDLKDRVWGLEKKVEDLVAFGAYVTKALEQITTANERIVAILDKLVPKS